MANVLMQLMLDIRQLQGALKQATASMQTATTRMSRQVQRAGREMQASGKKATGFANAIDFLKKRVFLAGLFFAGFYQGLIFFRQFVGAVISEFFNLDDALRRVQSITKETDESIGRLRGQLLDLAKAGALFDQSAADVADSMFTIAQAGFSTNESLTLAKLAAEGAAVGFTTAEVSAKVLVNVLKAYDMPVSKAREVMDILFQTVDTGIVTFEDLSNNLGRVLASASALGVPLTDITGTVATLTLRGFTAAQAMTSVNRILQTFIRPSGRAAKAADALGIALTRDKIAADGLVPVLNEMWIASGQNANKFAEMFDRIQSTRGALSLMTDDGVLLTRVMEDMGAATLDAGAMALAQEQRTKSLKFQMAILRSQFLAVVTEGLTPLTGAIAEFIQQLHRILSGQNALFNYFADLKSLVVAVVVAFLWMKRAAFVAMFQSMAAALANFASVMLISVGHMGVMRTAMMALSTAASALAPLLVFLAIFALAKFGKHLSAMSGVVDRAKESMGDYAAHIRQIHDEAAELNLDQMIIDTAVVDETMKALNGTMDVFTGALDNTRSQIRGYGLDAGAVFNEVGRFFSVMTLGMLDWGATSDEVIKAYVDNLRDTIQEGSLGVEQVWLLEQAYDDLRFSAENALDREMYQAGFVMMQNIRLEGDELSNALEKAANEAGQLDDEFDDGVISANAIKEAVSKWLDPIKSARDMMKEILGLTTKEEVKLRAEIAPLEVEKEFRSARILVLEGDILARKRELVVAGIDVDDVEDGILITLENQIDSLDAQNEATQNLIDQKESELTIQDSINDSLMAKAALENASLLLSYEQNRELAELARIVNEEGVPALADWLLVEKEFGRVLDEEVGDRLTQIIFDMGAAGELEISVEDALIQLGLVEAKINSLPRLLNVEEAYKADGILAAQAAASRFQHGVRNFVGGMALVGEAGPELVRLPRGVDVVPQGSIGQALRTQSNQPAASLSASAEVNITTSLLKDFQELKAAVLRAVDERLDEAAARVGMSAPRFGTFGAGVPRI